MNDDMRCVCNPVKQRVHAAGSPRALRPLAIKKKNVPAICRAPLTQAPLSVPTVRPGISHSAATPRPQQLPHVSHPQRTPTPAQHSSGGFRKPGYSVTEKSPTRRIQFLVLLGQPSPCFLFGIFTVNCPSQRIIRALTDSWAILMGEDETVSHVTAVDTEQKSGTTL